MGLKDSFISLMGDFVQLNRNPEFRSKNELNTAGTSAESPANYRKNRRHSLNITVGAQGPPDTFVRPRTYSVSTNLIKHGDTHSVGKGSFSSAVINVNQNRRNSAPCIKKPLSSFQLGHDSSLPEKKSKLLKQKFLKDQSPKSSKFEFRQPVAIEEEEEEESPHFVTLRNGNVTTITTKL